MSACQGYGQANQITVCVHDAKAYALRGIEAVEDSSATNLGCSNLREKQKEAIISFVGGKDVLVQLQLEIWQRKVSLLLFVAMATVRISHSCDTTRSITFYQTLSLGWGVACETKYDLWLYSCASPKIQKICRRKSSHQDSYLHSLIIIIIIQVSNLRVEEQEKKRRT